MLDALIYQEKKCPLEYSHVENAVEIQVRVDAGISMLLITFSSEQLYSTVISLECFLSYS